MHAFESTSGTFPITLCNSVAGGDLWIRGNPKLAIVNLPEILFVKANLSHLLEYGRK